MFNKKKVTEKERIEDRLETLEKRLVDQSGSLERLQSENKFLLKKVFNLEKGKYELNDCCFCGHSPEIVFEKSRVEKKVTNFFGEERMVKTNFFLPKYKVQCSNPKCLAKVETEQHRTMKKAVADWNDKKKTNKAK